MSLKYLLDTDTCIYITKQKPARVLEKFETLSLGEIGISVITYGELVYGAHKSHQAQKTLHLLDKLVELIPPLPIPIETGKYYGKVRRELEKTGKIIGNNDLWIAAHALAMDLVLVTNNEREFSRVLDLKIENWV